MALLYLHKSICISPQQTFGPVNLATIRLSAQNRLPAFEPAYPFFNKNSVRRMGKSTRMGTGAALLLLEGESQPNGILIGTQVSGMDENGRFLEQIIDYNEDTLTPGNFVQGTPNSISSQIALLTGNKNYNITHVHRGHAFENALIDAAMLLTENPEHQYLLGAVDEISENNFILDSLSGWIKAEECSNDVLYASNTSGSINGEGATMFLVNAQRNGALAAINKVLTLHTQDDEQVAQELAEFMAGQQIDMLISGYDGDLNLRLYYQAVEQGTKLPVARFKHLTGEYPTASAFGVWLACQAIQNADLLPPYLFVDSTPPATFNQILIYNCHKGIQHSFILVGRA